MEKERERVKKVELIQKAIDQLIKHEQLQSKTCHLLDDSFVAVDNDDDEEADHRHQLLSQLVTQVSILFSTICVFCVKDHKDFRSPLTIRVTLSFHFS